MRTWFVPAFDFGTIRNTRDSLAKMASQAAIQLTHQLLKDRQLTRKVKIKGTQRNVGGLRDVDYRSIEIALLRKKHFGHVKLPLPGGLSFAGFRFDGVSVEHL